MALMNFAVQCSFLLPTLIPSELSSGGKHLQNSFVAYDTVGHFALNVHVFMRHEVQYSPKGKTHVGEKGVH